MQDPNYENMEGIEAEEVATIKRKSKLPFIIVALILVGAVAVGGYLTIFRADASDTFMREMVKHLSANPITESLGKIQSESNSSRAETVGMSVKLSVDGAADPTLDAIFQIFNGAGIALEVSTDSEKGNMGATLDVEVSGNSLTASVFNDETRGIYLDMRDITGDYVFVSNDFLMSNLDVDLKELTKSLNSAESTAPDFSFTESEKATIKDVFLVFYQKNIQDDMITTKDGIMTLSITKDKMPTLMRALSEECLEKPEVKVILDKKFQSIDEYLSSYYTAESMSLTQMYREICEGLKSLPVEQSFDLEISIKMNKKHPPSSVLVRVGSEEESFSYFYESTETSGAKTDTITLTSIDSLNEVSTIQLSRVTTANDGSFSMSVTSEDSTELLSITYRKTVESGKTSYHGDLMVNGSKLGSYSMSHYESSDRKQIDFSVSSDLNITGESLGNASLLLSFYRLNSFSPYNPPEEFVSIEELDEDYYLEAMQSLLSLVGLDSLMDTGYSEYYSIFDTMTLPSAYQETFSRDLDYGVYYDSEWEEVVFSDSWECVDSYIPNPASDCYLEDIIFADWGYLEDYKSYNRVVISSSNPTDDLLLYLNDIAQQYGFTPVGSDNYANEEHGSIVVGKQIGDVDDYILIYTQYDREGWYSVEIQR